MEVFLPRFLPFLGICWCVLLHGRCWGLPLPLRWGLDARWTEDREDSTAIVAAASSTAGCALCIDSITLLQIVVDSNGTLNDILPLAEKICIVGIKEISGYIGAVMCPGMVRSYGPAMLYVVAHTTLQPRDMCERLHLCENSTTSATGTSNGDPLLQMMSKLRTTLGDILGVGGGAEKDRGVSVSNQTGLRNFKTGKTPQRQGNEKEGEALVEKEKVGEKLEGDKGWIGGRKSSGSPDTITILQLADIHLDTKYKEGSPSQCNLYLCCRGWYNGTTPAGHYGDYQCDLPLVTLDLLMETLKGLDPQPDFAVYTGDNPPHDIWNETWASQINATKFVVSYLHEHLPDLVIYPAIGNHETWPESEYLASLPEYQYLTKELAEYWQSWVPNFPSAALATIAEGGYYSMEIMEGLRLLSFNSDYGYTSNFYAFLNADNPSYQRMKDWIFEELTQAEEAGDKVLLIAHIPPGITTALPEYGEFYLNMTKRFGATIIGHLLGHTHEDMFELAQDSDGVYGAVMVAPSVTPYGHINPSFRLFSMDRETHQLLGYQQYHLNLTKANELAAQGLKPHFELAYSSSVDYELKDLSPASWADLVERFKEDDSLLNSYHYNVHARSISADRTCDQLCKIETLCAVNNVESAEYFKCLT